MNERPRYIQFGRRVWDRVNVGWYGEWTTGNAAGERCAELNRMDVIQRKASGDTSFLRMVWKRNTPVGFGPQNMMYS